MPECREARISADPQRGHRKRLAAARTSEPIRLGHSVAGLRPYFSLIRVGVSAPEFRAYKPVLVRKRRVGASAPKGALIWSCADVNVVRSAAMDYHLFVRPKIPRGRYH